MTGPRRAALLLPLAALPAPRRLRGRAGGARRRRRSTPTTAPAATAPAAKATRATSALYPGLDLTRSEMIAKGARTVIHRRIAQGYGPMPGFAHRLSPEEIQALVDFCLELQQGKEE